VGGFGSLSSFGLRSGRWGGGAVGRGLFSVVDRAVFLGAGVCGEGSGRIVSR